MIKDFILDLWEKKLKRRFSGYTIECKALRNCILINKQAKYSYTKYSYNFPITNIAVIQYYETGIEYHHIKLPIEIPHYSRIIRINIDDPNFITKLHKLIQLIIKQHEGRYQKTEQLYKEIT